MATRSSPRRRRRAAGVTVPAYPLVAISGAPAPVPDPQRVVPLQMRRSAGCPVCDFLIAPDGRVHACHYGAHVDDHWSVDEVLAHARVATSRPPIPTIGIPNDVKPTAHG